jgi:hypothetical protein
VQPLKYLLLAVAALAFTAHAQLRTIPAEAKPATLRHVHDMVVELDGKPARLSPGAQIRDSYNRLVLPASLADKTTVRYLSDASGMVHRVWILSPEEAARLPKPEPKKDDKTAQ